ncbi:hypothetical protein [Pedobacter sp. R-06]|uniref:hypothetical protein n=1 Tax=Pedobacter sp. R-06 TaxID=3404051 RepID=UPI003CF6FC79
MKNHFILAVLVLFFLSGSVDAQEKSTSEQKYWNTNIKLTSWRIPPPPIGYKPRLVDLDKDGDPDLLYSVTSKNIPVLWVDDDDDMTWSDLEGDTDSDCLLIDKNRDGKYGGMGDLIIDWVDNNQDNKADMQIIVDYPQVRTPQAWPNGHYMVVLDTDKDNVFNYIDWNNFEIKAWDRNGLSDFFLDYSGKSAFLKIHVATYTMENLKLNWENPFLFYDPDNDGLSEMAIRFVDSPKSTPYHPGDSSSYNVKLGGKIDWVSIAVDMDNDNAPGNEFDYDFSLNFRGGGFDYMDQIHKFKNMRGLKAADTLFMDPRWRQMDELIYPDHDSALDLIFNRGKWNKVYFVYDEDDDCNRWERVEFYDPLDPFKVGPEKGGIDNNVQSDPAGDRGEWDLDNSGKGQLYISKFDGRLHLYGAEWGAWRIDQNASFYQGWDRKWLNKDPNQFATVKYIDSDNNGFIDKILYDLDGDKLFEDSVDLAKLKLKDVCEVVDISKFKYDDYVSLHKKMADQLWRNAGLSLEAAKKYGVNTSWYAKLSQANSAKEKYNNGYWLQFYVYRDLKDHFLRKKDKDMLHKLDLAYYGADWQSL